MYTLDQILKSRSVYEPLTMLQCCPTSDGAAAAIVASEAFVKKHGLEGQVRPFVCLRGSGTTLLVVLGWC